jgi:DNA polymerase IV
MGDPPAEPSQAFLDNCILKQYYQGMLRSLLVDFNSFFASVEQQLDPALRGRPVGVVPVVAETTCCIAASYEAKRHGVKTGTGIAQARQLCPDIVFVLAQHEKYVAVHHQAVAAIDRIAPVRQVLSIDEMECELPKRWASRAQAVTLAGRIKQEILRTVGDQLHTSIGIAPNTLLAKLASNMQKPNGLTVLEMHDIPNGLLHLPVQAINGIGSRLFTRLARHGVHTMADLYAAPRELLRLAWGGIAGSEMYDMLRGQWYAPRQAPTRSLGHSHVMPPAMRNPTDALAVLSRLMQKAAMRLRKQGFYATALSVSVRCGHAYASQAQARQAGGHRETRFGQTQDTAFLLHSLHALWHDGLHLLMQPKAVGLVLHGLVPVQQHTPGLFDSDALPIDAHPAVTEKEKQAGEAWPIPMRPTLPTPQVQHPPRDRQPLLQAMDAICKRYGKNALHFACAQAGLDHAPMRIAFNRIPDLETER